MKSIFASLENIANTLEQAGLYVEAEQIDGIIKVARMAMDEAYGRLDVEGGFTKDIGVDGVKKVYRDLMRKYHPDQYHNQPEEYKRATEKAKDINEAWNIVQSDLSGGGTELKRYLARKYVQQSGRGPQYNDLEDLFNDFFGGSMGGFGRQRETQQNRLRQEIHEQMRKHYEPDKADDYRMNEIKDIYRGRSDSPKQKINADAYRDNFNKIKVRISQNPNDVLVVDFGGGSMKYIVSPSYIVIPPGLQGMESVVFALDSASWENAIRILLQNHIAKFAQYGAYPQRLYGNQQALAIFKRDSEQFFSNHPDNQGEWRRRRPPTSYGRRPQRNYEETARRRREREDATQEQMDNMNRRTQERQEEQERQPISFVMSSNVNRTTGERFRYWKVTNVPQAAQEILRRHSGKKFRNYWSVPVNKKDQVEHDLRAVGFESVDG